MENQRIAAYMRVSRAGMTVENQRLILEKWIADNVASSEIHWFSEQESTRKVRPEREKLLQLLKNKEYDALICVRLDRWGRSTIEIIDSVQELIELGIRVVFVQNGFDWCKKNFNAMAKFQLDVLSAFANLERELIRERTLEGLARAEAEGRKGGRRVGSKDKKPRRRSGYWLRWQKEKTKGVNNKTDKQTG